MRESKKKFCISDFTHEEELLRAWISNYDQSSIGEMDLMQGLCHNSKSEMFLTSDLCDAQLFAKIRTSLVWFLVMILWWHPCYRPFPKRGAMTVAG